MPNEIPLINGKAYAWANVEISIGGVPVIGVTAIDYEDSEEKEHERGSGKFPIARAEGNYEAKASVTLKASEDEALIAKSPTGRLQDLGVFDIIVQYLVGTVRKTHKIRNCEFLGNKRSLKQGDKTIEVEHPLIISHIEWK